MAALALASVRRRDNRWLQSQLAIERKHKDRFFREGANLQAIFDTSPGVMRLDREGTRIARINLACLAHLGGQAAWNCSASPATRSVASMPMRTAAGFRHGPSAAIHNAVDCTSDFLKLAKSTREVTLG